MTNGFDGTEALTYRHEPHAGVVNLSAIPYECLAEERDVRESRMKEKEADRVASLGSCDPYDGVDETQLGCAGEIAQSTDIKFQIGVDPDWDATNPRTERIETLKLSVGAACMSWLIQVSTNDSVSLAQAREMHPELDTILESLEYAAQLRNDSW